MRTQCFKILSILLAGGVFFQLGAQDPGPRKWPLQLTPRSLELPDFNAPPAPVVKTAARQNLRLAGSATVEVVGDAFWEHTERLRLFKMELAPELTRAFALGSASTTNRQQLGEFMALGGDFRTPSIPSVYYNGLRPSMEDPELARNGIHLSTTRGRSTVTLSAGNGR